MGHCSNCEGEKVSSTCLIWEGIEVPFDSFNELIEAIYTTVYAGEAKIDLKTLSNSRDTSLHNAVQVLIDREVKRLHQSTTVASSTPTCNINVSSLDNCTTCNKSFCDKLQLMVNEIAMLRAEVNQLKTQI